MKTCFAAIFVALIAWRSTETLGAERPNVLLIVSDDLTATALGCYGNDVCQTPHLDRLASEGVLFEHAYCQYPVCGPSRASFMSGLYPNTTKMLRNSKELGAFKTSNPKLADHPSIGELLKNNGYFSARVSKIYHMGIPGGIEAGEPGGDEPASWDWAYNVLAPETFSPGELELLTPTRPHWGSNFSTVVVPDEFEATQTDVIAVRQAIAVLENRSGDRLDVKTRDNRPKAGDPFFLAVGFVRPHVPLVAPERLFKMYPASETNLPDVPETDLDDVPKPAAAMRNIGRYDMNEEQQRKAIAGYYASVSFMDEQVGRLLEALDRLELRDNTIVIFISDHGYNLGEHECWQKLSLFEESTSVPLLISAPGFEDSSGRSAEGIVELIDLYPTIAELVGLKDNVPANLQGTSLRPLLEDPSGADWTKTAAYTVTHQQGESIRTDRWRYNNWGNAGEELYDHQTDPHEFTNLADDPEYADVLEEMRAALETARQKSGDVSRPDNNSVPDEDRRVGRVRLEGHSLVDDGGPFLGLGASYFTALWRCKHDRARLESDLEFLSSQGFNYYRMLSMVGWNRAWDGLEIAPISFTNQAGKPVDAWPDYWQQFGALIDLAYDRHGMRTQITIFADAQLMPDKSAKIEHMKTLLDNVIRGREHKIMLLEVANEGWQNGFPGEQGIAEMREFAKFLDERTKIPIAITSNHVGSFHELYDDSAADLATWHFSRDRGPDGGWVPVYDCWDLGNVPGAPPVISNEPIGPGSSVDAETEEIRLVAAAAFAYLAKLPAYIFHSDAGVFGKTRFEEMPGITRYRRLLELLPGDLANWERNDGKEPAAPFTVFTSGKANAYCTEIELSEDGCVRNTGSRKGGRFICLPIGIRPDGLELQARQDVRFRVYNPLSGKQELSATTKEGERLTLPQGPGALIIIGSVLPSDGM